MKKFFTMAAIALFTMTSCSEDDATPTTNNDTNAILIKKIVTNGAQGIYTDIYSYNGTKLSGITRSDGSYETITYQGDLIKTWQAHDADNTIIYDATFYYENGQLKESVSIFDNDGIVVTRTYSDNGDGSVTCLETYNGSGSRTSVFYPNKYSYTFGEFDGGGSYLFEFDNKKSPYANISGYGKIILELDSNPLQSEHNIVSEFALLPDGTINTQLRASTYTYNNLDYPVTEHVVQYGDAGTDIQYFYE